MSGIEQGVPGNTQGKVLSPFIPEEIADVYYPEGQNYILPEEPKIARYVQRAKKLESENNQRAAAKYYLMAYKKVSSTTMAPFLLFKYGSLQSDIIVISNILEELVEKYPDFSLINGARFYLAEKLYILGDYEGARFYLRDVINKEQDTEPVFTPFAWGFLGMIYIRNERWLEAEESFKRAIPGVINSGVSDYRYYLLKDYLGLSECYVSKKETDKAEKLLLTISSTSNYDDIKVEALYRLFKLYYKIGKKDIASGIARLLDENYPDSYYIRYIKKNYEIIDKEIVFNISDKFYDASIYERDFFDRLEERLSGEALKESKSTFNREPESGFMIQLGSFKDEKNARKLAEELKKIGYEPILINTTVNDEDIIRVRLGYYSSRSKAEKELENLKNRGYSGFIIRE